MTSGLVISPQPTDGGAWRLMRGGDQDQRSAALESG
jgi:hypothetical protein